MINLLYISNLFPDREEFNRGIFNARLVRHISKYCNVRVLSPRPGFFFWKKYFCCKEDEKTAPVYKVVPYIPLWCRFNHILMRLWLKPIFSNIYNKYKFNIALASWLFPDACATARLARAIGVPFVATALGTDVHQYINLPVRKKIIFEELKEASAVITVSKSLAGILQDAGFNKDKIHTIYYGVEQNIFKPGEKEKTRERLDLPRDSAVILFVGNFLPIKDPLLALKSYSVLIHKYKLKNSLFVLIGDGVLRSKLKSESTQLGIEKNIRFAGRKTPEEIALYMQASDVLLLTSHNEGVPNVVLEAMSCGLPPVVTKVGGIPEIIENENLGKMVAERSPEKIADAIYETLKNPPDKNYLINHCKKYDWDNTAKEYINLLENIVEI